MEIPRLKLNNGQKLLNAVKARDVEEIKNILSHTRLRFHAIAYAYGWALYQAKELAPNQTLRAHPFMQEAIEKVRLQRKIALDRLLVFDAINASSGDVPIENKNRKKQIDETLIDQRDMYITCAQVIRPYLELLIPEDSNNPTILFFYVGAFGHLDLLQDVAEPYKDKIDWNFCNEYGKTLLHIHAQEGNLAIVDYLLNKGADYNKQTFCYEKRNEEDEEEDIFLDKTPLHYAAQYRQEAVVKRLLDAGSNVTIDDHFNKLPLHYVAPGKYGNQKIFEMLLDHGANIDATNKGRTLLWEAIEEKKYTTIEYLLRLGANPSKSLPTRIFSSNRESFEILLALGANIDTPSCNNKTLLYKAVEEGNFNTIEYLLQRGADPDKELESRFCFKTMKFYTDSPLELAYRQAYLDTPSSEEDCEEETERIYRLLQKYRKTYPSLETSSESS